MPFPLPSSGDNEGNGEDGEDDDDGAEADGERESGGRTGWINVEGRRRSAAVAGSRRIAGILASEEEVEMDGASAGVSVGRRRSMAI